MTDERPGYYNGLYATPTRLRLLRDIADGEVYRDPYDTSERYYRDDGTPCTVTAQVKAVIGAGWAVEVHLPFAPKVTSQPVRLTELGEQILKGDRR